MASQERQPAWSKSMSRIEKKTTLEAKNKAFGLFSAAEVQQAAAERLADSCVQTDNTWGEKGNGVKFMANRKRSGGQRR